MLAEHARDFGEVPVGAVVIRDGQLLGQGWNKPIAACDPSAHAEIVALRAAGLAVGNYRMPGTTLYVTLEPCAMCAGAIVHARVQRLVFGAWDKRSGVVCSVTTLFELPSLNHRVTVQGGVRSDDCSSLLQAFFAAKRQQQPPSGRPDRGAPPA